MVSTTLSSVQPLSVQLLAAPWTAARQASLSITNSQSLPKLTSTESPMPSNPLILCRPLLLLPSIFPSIRVFSNESSPCSPRDSQKSSPTPQFKSIKQTNKPATTCWVLVYYQRRTFTILTEKTSSFSKYLTVMRPDFSHILHPKLYITTNWECRNKTKNSFIFY